MKKFYENPELVLIKLAKADIVTTSPDDLWDPSGDDKDWDGYLDGNT